MDKEESVINYYLICNKLKDVIRKWTIIWNVKKRENVAEHIYSVQMLALAMKSQYQYDIDIMKVINMLSVHELGEAITDDLTMFDIGALEKKKIEHEAVHKILNDLIDRETIENLFLEFDEGKTKEAIFAFQCDKLDADLQAKIAGDMGYVDLNDQASNYILNDVDVKRLLDEGNSFGEMFLKFSQGKYPYDDNFLSISNYALTHKLIKK